MTHEDSPKPAHRHHQALAPLRSHHPENAATVAEQGAHVAPEKAFSKKGATQTKGAAKGLGRKSDDDHSAC
jgi:hypothetical protein